MIPKNCSHVNPPLPVASPRFVASRLPSVAPPWSQVQVRERIHKMVQKTEQRGFTATLAQMEN